MISKINKFICALCVMGGVAGLTSCEDFFNQGSEHVIFADQDHLNNAADTLWSVVGIMNKLQAVADRTILLGEMRADLVDVTDASSADLIQLAYFNVDENNIYNQPRDYYAVINNCNYFIAKADTALKNNRSEYGGYIFMREYVSVKAFRAWTYLQLALNYGRVPFVTEPILTKGASEADYPMYGIEDICEHFINDLTPLIGIIDYMGKENPGYGTIRSNDSRFFYFPVRMLLGELNLWAGHYREAAQWYYNFISTRLGANSSYCTDVNEARWDATGGSWDRLVDSWSQNTYNNESYGNGDTELITYIPGDSIPSEGNYSQLRLLFNSQADNEYKVSIQPSKAMFDLSESQMYCMVTNNGRDTIYAPKNLEDHQSGDLRLSRVYSSRERTYNNEKINDQSIDKYSTRNVHIWRRTMLYLHLAEALNRAGYPRFAYAILSTGVNNDVIETDVIPYHDANDSIWLKTFDFPTSRCIVATAQGTAGQNMSGIHNHGSGWTPANKYYQFPDDSTLTDPAARLAYQQEAVERMIVDECALEFAFEGQRFYDLMRVALRRNDPAFLADRIYARRGEDKVADMKALIRNDLYQPRNWYLNWNGKIGFNE